MKSKRMKIKDLGQGVWLLDDNGESTCYVVCGTEKAMVIDTVNGAEDLKAIVRTITDLPLVVVNTHGHCDHIFGNMYFEEAWMHPEDQALAERHFSMFRDVMDKQGLTPCPFRWLEVGQVFDLGGGSKLEVVSLRGHTQGSVGLLDRGRRILFSGDGCNPHIWMQLPESGPIRQLRDTLTDLKAQHGDEFDAILYGHAHEGAISAGLVDDLLRACDELLRGDTANDLPYEYFAGVCKKHPYVEDPDAVVVYDDDKL